MDDQRWRQIEAVYLAALDAPDRQAFLNETCRDDSELRAAVDLLLTQEPTTVSLFGKLALQGLVTVSEPADRELLAPDSQLGSYRIVTRLGSGGSSDVYKAYDTRLDRHVALKVFDGTRVTEEFRQRFARESRAAASLNHPNIATVYEIGEAERVWFIAMEFVDGRTLRDVFGDPACVPRQRLELLAQAASGVARAHANGLAHCDLKPDNIMVTQDGLVKVLDFGLARLVGSSESSGRRFEGTIGYMSPEQAEGKTIDVRSDVFSFGCTLFEAVTGTRPFAGERWFEALMHAPPPRLGTSAHSVPDGVQALIDDCLVKEPAKRLASLNEVSRRLQAILHARTRINRWVLSLISIAALLLSAVAYWLWPTSPPAGSVAVIPFATAETTADARRLADGISEGVINVLAQLPDLKVIARSSSFRFTGDSLDIPMVARALGVQTLVTGRITNSNGRPTIRAELVSGQDGTVMWGSSFTPSLDHVMDVEGQIAREIARRVRSELTPADQRRLDKAVHPNNDVYSLLLRGRYEMQLYTLPSALNAKSYFEQALGIDSAYALANAELANAYIRLASNGGLRPNEALQRGEQAALKAIALDEEVPEAHAALANILRDKWQFADAEREYRRAIDLSPSFGPARQGLAITLTLTGKRDEAVAEITRARELDPVGLPGAVESAAVFYNLRLYDRALAALSDGLTIDSRAAVLWQWLGIVNGGQGEFTRAISALERAMELGYNTPATRSFYVHALARAGRRDEAVRQLRTLETDGSVVAPSFLAIAYLGLGDRERALSHLQAGYNAHDPLLQYIVVESFLDGVMADPRFQKIVVGMGLPLPQRP